MVHRSESDLTFDEIIFESRNKSYGAYDLRHIYNSHLKTAILIAASAFVLALLSPQIYQWLKPTEVVEEELFDITEVKLSEPPPIDPKTPPPPPAMKIEAPKIKTIKFVPPVITEEAPIEEEPLPKNEELVDAKISTTTQEGESTNLNEVVTEGTGHEEVGPAVEEVLDYVGEPSEFKGGEFGSFLRNNLKYPHKAQDEEIEGSVFVQFTVEKDGTITDVVKVKGIGYGCDEEAIRVIKLTSGKWSAGKNNGHPVRSKKIQKITFKLPD